MYVEKWSVFNKGEKFAQDVSVNGKHFHFGELMTKKGHRVFCLENRIFFSENHIFLNFRDRIYDPQISNQIDAARFSVFSFLFVVWLPLYFDHDAFTHHA